jgi:hypothetical protein
MRTPSLSVLHLPVTAVVGETTPSASSRRAPRFQKATFSRVGDTLNFKVWNQQVSDELLQKIADRLLKAVGASP